MVDNQTEYKDCQCVPDGKIATPGSCDKKCELFPGFLVLVFINIWFTFMSAMPNVVATLRAVEPIHRSLGLGIESIILRYVFILTYHIYLVPTYSNFYTFLG